MRYFAALIMSPAPQVVTKLLIQWSNGDHAALDQLMPLVYAELHRMAKRYMNRQNQTLQTTALIHEAWFRLVRESVRKWENSNQFFGIAAKAMRHVLIDHARASQAAKRGGEKKSISLDQVIVIADDRMAQIVALDDALTDLAKLSKRQSDVVELRYFGGLSVEETAEILKISPETVMRDWRAAKAWLYRELSRSHHAENGAE
jgi:RNA polymerase sigma-70 factor (ECF subfamily)